MSYAGRVGGAHEHLPTLFTIDDYNNALSQIAKAIWDSSNEKEGRRTVFIRTEMKKGFIKEKQKSIQTTKTLNLILKIVFSQESWQVIKLTGCFQGTTLQA